MNKWKVSTQIIWCLPIMFIVFIEMVLCCLCMLWIIHQLLCFEVAKRVAIKEYRLNREALGLDEILLEVNHITEHTISNNNSVMERWFDRNFTIELKVREIDWVWLYANLKSNAGRDNYWRCSARYSILSHRLITNKSRWCLLGIRFTQHLLLFVCRRERSPVHDVAQIS